MENPLCDEFADLNFGTPILGKGHDKARSVVAKEEGDLSASVKTSHHRRFIDDQLLYSTCVTYETNKQSEISEQMKELKKGEHSALSGTRALFTFVQPTAKLKITYREQQARLRRSVARHKDLQDGVVLDTMEKGVNFPVIHVNFRPRLIRHSKSAHGALHSSAATAKEGHSAAAEDEISKAKGNAKAETAAAGAVIVTGKNCRLLKEDALGSGVHTQQGLYEELRRIEPDVAFCPRDNVDQRAFIVLGFKTLDTTFSEVLEATWRDWTGARAIYLRLHNQFDLSKIVFYRRVSPRTNLDMFTYIVCVECWNVNNSNLIHMLDFVQRMRVERLNGYISLYRDLGLEEEDSNYHSGDCDEFDDEGLSHDEVDHEDGDGGVASRGANGLDDQDSVVDTDDAGGPDHRQSRSSEQGPPQSSSSAVRSNSRTRT